MDADGFRKLYEYHFKVNRKLWDQCITPMSDRQFREKLTYSHGSIRHQAVHIMNTDDRWFSDLRGEEVPGIANPVHYGTRAVVREKWDGVEARMREYLQTLKNEDLGKMTGTGMTVAEVLFHVLNHGTDHRAQTLAMLNQMGVETFGQDYAYFAWGRL